MIVVTAHGGVQGAVEAMRLGAADYLVKPFEPEELPLVLERARRSRQTGARRGTPPQSTGRMADSSSAIAHTVESATRKILLRGLPHDRRRCRLC